VLEGAKNELNDTDGSQVGNGYTRSVTFEFIVNFYCLFVAACIYTLYSFSRFVWIIQLYLKIWNNIYLLV